MTRRSRVLWGLNLLSRNNWSIGCKTGPFWQVDIVKDGKTMTQKSPLKSAIKHVRQAIGATHWAVGSARSFCSLNQHHEVRRVRAFVFRGTGLNFGLFLCLCKPWTTKQYRINRSRPISEWPGRRRWHWGSTASAPDSRRARPCWPVWPNSSKVFQQSTNSRHHQGAMRNEAIRKQRNDESRSRHAGDAAAGTGDDRTVLCLKCDAPVRGKMAVHLAEKHPPGSESTHVPGTYGRCSVCGSRSIPGDDLCFTHAR